MSKDKQIVNKKKSIVAENMKVDRLNEEDISSWAEFFEGYSEDTDHVLSLADTVANLDDLTAVMRYFDKNMENSILQRMHIIVSRLSVLESIVLDKLDVDDEEYKEYEAKYEEEMEQVKEELARVQEAQEEALAEESEEESEDNKDNKDNVVDLEQAKEDKEKEEDNK